MSASWLSPAGPMLRLRVDDQATVVDVSMPRDIPGPRTGAADGDGAGAWMGAVLPDHTAPSQSHALATWLDRARSPASIGEPFPWRARRLDGLPLVLLLHSLGGDEVAAQRAGGEVVQSGHLLPSGAPNTGPDHVLNHDVRGSLRNARAFLALYTRKLGAPPAPGAAAPPAADPEMLTKVVRTLVNADSMADGLVRFHRLDTDPMTMGPVSLGHVAVRAARQAEEQLADLATAGEPDLAGGLVVHGAGKTDDRDLLIGRDDLLGWVLAELCVNARKFGGPTVVSITTEAAGRWVLVRVANSGPPIDRSLAESAFALGRLLQPRGDRPGVGLGLPLCRRILTRHAGAIGFVEPRWRDGEEGTEVELELPLAAPAQP